MTMPGKDVRLLDPIDPYMKSAHSRVQLRALALMQPLPLCLHPSGLVNYNSLIDPREIKQITPPQILFTDTSTIRTDRPNLVT